MRTEAPDYGFKINTDGNTKTITVASRKGMSAFMIFCAIFSSLVFAPILGGIIYFIIDTNTGRMFNTSSDVFWVPTIILFILILYGLNKVFTRDFGKRTIRITNNHLSINGKNYDRSHITGWTVRWNNVSAAPTVSGIAAMQAAKHSHSITFDYASKTIAVVIGLTEGSANQLMAAIQNAL